jgi:hypothetical protein
MFALNGGKHVASFPLLFSFNEKLYGTCYYQYITVKTSRDDKGLIWQNLSKGD